MANKSDDAGNATKDDVLGFIQSKAMDAQADYLKRGRIFEKLTDAELSDQYATAFNVWVESWDPSGEREPPPPKLKQLEEDLNAEMGLRDLALPMDRIEGGFAKLRSMADENIRRLNENPQALRQRNAELEAEIGEFKAQRDKAKN